MKLYSDIVKDRRVLRVMDANPEDGMHCMVCLNRDMNHPATVIASWGLGWDHVSAHFDGRRTPPTWEEMCELKDVFFTYDECVMQLHPRKKDWVNIHSTTLHLWRPQNEPIPTPPKIMV